MTILLELARLFSRFYKSTKTQPSVNMVFLLSSGGKFNYFGTKKWLENHLDASSSSELLSDVKYCLCLDTLGNKLLPSPLVDEVESLETKNVKKDSPQENINAYTLNMHVSKPPKEDSDAGRFFDSLQKMASKIKSGEGEVHGTEYHPKVEVKLVHKKINLADEKLAWEHERFSIRRLSAFTLSNADSHDSLDKVPTILDRVVDTGVVGK